MKKILTSTKRCFIASPPILLTLATLFWAGNTVIGKAANPLIPAFSLSFWRWTVAFILILPFGVKFVIKDWEFYREKWKYLFLLALISVTAYNTLLYWALNWTTAINVSVVCATMPLVIFIFSWLIGGQKANNRQILGVIFAVFGVLIVITKGEIDVILRLKFNYGDILALMSVICFGIYSILLKKSQINVNQIGLITVFIFFGLIGITPFYAWDLVHEDFFSINNHMVYILLYVGLFPSLLSFFFWNKAIERGGAHIAGMFFNLIPVFSSVFAVIFLKENFTLSHLTGMIFIFSGIYVATFYRAKE